MSRASGREDFSDRRPVTSREGQAIGRVLASIARDGSAPAESGPRDRAPSAPVEPSRQTRAGGPHADDIHGGEVEVIDDSDMVVIEEDLATPVTESQPTVFSVRPSDYRSLFTRLRRSRG
jgi:hypothetical protein